MVVDCLVESCDGLSCGERYNYTSNMGGGGGGVVSLTKA